MNELRCTEVTISDSCLSLRPAAFVPSGAQPRSKLQKRWIILDAGESSQIRQYCLFSLIVSIHNIPISSRNQSNPRAIDPLFCSWCFWPRPRPHAISPPGHHPASGSRSSITIPSHNSLSQLQAFHHPSPLRHLTWRRLSRVACFSASPVAPAPHHLPKPPPPPLSCIARRSHLTNLHPTKTIAIPSHSPARHHPASRPIPSVRG